jgi:hypothetical protein
MCGVLMVVCLMMLVQYNEENHDAKSDGFVCEGSLFPTHNLGKEAMDNQAIVSGLTERLLAIHQVCWVIITLFKNSPG